MPDTDAAEPDGLPYRIPRATPGRRQEDHDLRKLMRNRWAKRIGYVIVMILAFWAGLVRDEWARIPSREWTSQVNEAVINTNATRAQLTTLSVRVDNLQQAVETNSLQDAERQREVLTEIRGLRSDVKQAVKDASAAATAAARARNP